MLLCPVCGKEIAVKKGQRGRPQQYHPECRQLRTALYLLESRIESWKEVHQPDKKYKNGIRKLLFVTSNLLN